MDSKTQKSNPPKRLPSSLIERNLKTTNLLIRIGLQTSGNMISDLFMGKSVNLKKSLFSPKNAYSTVETLKQLRGAAMKFGQLISIDEQLIFTPEISQIIGQLRSSGYSMPPRQVKKILDENWGPGWLRNFDSFEVQPFAAASIGQVHRAKLKNGLELAIKIQFPNIRETIKNDMRSLRFLVNRAKFLPQDFNSDYYFKICEEQLIAESEYI
jgi:Predicted unusual protein kinase